jgi:myo-inositol-1(or 4)-monophosphatase
MISKIENKLSTEEIRFLRQAIAMAQKAGKRLVKSFRKEKPSERGTVKEVKLVYDIIADKIIRDSIEKHFPAHSYITEETGLVEKDSEFLWIVDPLDGTSNFADQNPMYAVSIALWKNGEPVLGIIEAPMMQERFVAVRNVGAYHQDFLRNKTNKANVSGVKKSSKSYGVYCEGGVKNKSSSIKLLSKYYMQIRDVRKLGSAALELAFVGMGRSESYMTTKISLWDIAAGILFVKEAGGEISHFDGSPYSWNEFGPKKTFDLLATNGKLRIKL